MQKYNESLGLIRLVFLMVLTLSCLASQTQSLRAQDISGINLAEINVDDLSDEQILNYMRQAEERGFAQQELEEAARLRGVSELQIAKLRERVGRLRLSGASTQSSGSTFNTRSAEVLSPDDVFGLLGNPEQGIIKPEGPQVFGLDLFRSDKLTFSPNLNIPTPPDYVLGPGDELIIDLWGATQQYWNLTVSPEGAIRPVDLSPIYVNGLSISQAESKIIGRLSQVYGGLKGTSEQEQNIFYQITLGNVRSISVTVVGEVTAPGNYVLNSLSTVFTALYAAGGPTEDGTFRKVKLMRNNELETEVDLYDFLVDGLRPNDKVLRDGDVIIVKLFDKRVEVKGEVKRPGIYELNEGETFATLLSHAGGFTSNAFKSYITVDRNGVNGKSVKNILQAEMGDFKPQDGDIISVREVEERYENRVQIEGAVLLEGDYELTEGLTVRSLIEKAQGLTGDAYMSRATLFRVNADFSMQSISFDLQQVLSGAVADIPLENEDVLRIFSVYELQEEFYVEINGEVSLPGIVPYITNMQVEDVVLLSGGLTEGATGARVEISRRNNGASANSVSEIITLNIGKDLKPVGGETIVLKPFDQIFIRRTANYRSQQLVTIEGEVSNPGQYAISRKDERISDIIERAGGITPYAYPAGALLIRRTEFAERQTDAEQNREKLLLLKERILKEDTTGILNQSRARLIERLKDLLPEDELYDNTIELDQGSQFKKKLTEGITETDSLITNVEISEEEPTVLELTSILEKPGSKFDYFVKEGDIISIPSQLETVRIAGEVISPLSLRYDKAFSFKDYINDAGGFTAKAKKGRSYVQYPNGRRRQTKRFLFFKFYPKVEPGSTLFISRKPERAPVNIQSIIAATGSIATLALVIDRLSN